jgi:hypothetical protein
MELLGSGLKSLSLASADFNNDGFPDLVAGYGAPEGGVLAVHFANAEAFAPRSAASLQGVAMGQFSNPLLASALAIRTEVAPELLAVGDFNRDGNLDILFTAKGSSALHIVYGDGTGKFSGERVVPVAAQITALAVGCLRTSCLSTDVVVGMYGGSGAIVAVYGTASSGISLAPVVYSTAGPVTALAIGQLDGGQYPGLAMVAGGRGYILHGGGGLLNGGGSVEGLSPASGIQDLDLGHFLPDRRHRTQISLLDASGTVTVLTRGPADRRPLTHEELVANRLSGRMSPSGGMLEDEWNDLSDRWVAAQTVATELSPARGDESSGHLWSTSGDLCVAGLRSNRVTVLTRVGGEPTLRAGTTLDATGSVVAVVSMRLSAMGAPGYVMLTDAALEPVAAATTPNVTYQVTGFGDSQTGVCSTPSGSPLTSSCTTLRAAIIASNSHYGQNLIVFVGNGTTTLSVPGLDDAAAVGDLDVTNALTIVGNGPTESIIRAGISLNSGIDKVFSFNPLGSYPGFPVSLTNLGIQFGTNSETDASTGNNEGGAFDFDASAIDGAGSLSVTNCDILQNATTNGDGGAFALFGGGVVTINQTAISGNQANMLGPDPYFGGGVFVGYSAPVAASVTMNNSSVSNNSAWTPNQFTLSQEGGGILSSANTVTLSGVTVSGNLASSHGGGLFGTFSLNRGSVVSANQSAGYGGGVFGVANITSSEIVGNLSLDSGGGLFGEGSGSSISDSRIVGNSAYQGANAVDSDAYTGSAVTATNNWWGSNASPATQVNAGLVTYTPWLVMTFAAPSSVNAGVALRWLPASRPAAMGVRASRSRTALR